MSINQSLFKPMRNVECVVVHSNKLYPPQTFLFPFPMNDFPNKTLIIVLCTKHFLLFFISFQFISIEHRETKENVRLICSQSSCLSAPLRNQFNNVGPSPSLPILHAVSVRADTRVCVIHSVYTEIWSGS